LIKGPIVYAFLLPGLAVFQWRRPNFPETTTAWCGWWPWLVSLAIFALWVGGGIRWIPGFYEEVVLKEFLGRFGETAHRPQPFYFYLPHLLHKFAPWSVLVIALAALGWPGQQMGLIERWRKVPPEVAWLLCWSLGGLLAMSLIPSKRVDRIFPVIAPLCLLLAAQYARLSATTEFAVRARRWSAIALAIACLSTSVYAASRVLGAVRSDEGALARFGADLRNTAVARGWRYEVIAGREEGVLLYLRRTHFVSATEAMERWKANLLDAIVTPAEELPGLLAALQDATPSQMEASVTINGQPRRYVVLIRDSLPR
jgi:hypothetical protein